MATFIIITYMKLILQILNPMKFKLFIRALYTLLFSLRQARSNTDEDYFESNCGGDGGNAVSDPAAAICKFRQVRGRILKTVDSVYSGVRSMEECKRKCVGANYR